MIADALSYIGIGLMRCMAWLPLPAVRALGWLMGRVLHAVVRSRRAVVRTNLLLCFPQCSVAERKALEVQVFICFAQAWLDRGWLWHASPAVVAKRLQFVGAVDALAGDTPTVIFAPHFMGMDAGGTALMMNVPRHYTSIYTDQSNKVVDAWMLRGRQRFGTSRLFGRVHGVREIANALKKGQPLYLLPDMDFGAAGAVFVPFFGTLAATVPSLSRFARLGGAQVVPMVTRLTPTGYEVRVLPAWENFPTKDAQLDTARMNTELQGYIRAMPEQYYWVHKRFKTRPDGQAELY